MGIICKVELRPYQQKDLGRIIQEFHNHNSILFEACVSYGKTYLACALLEKCIGWGKNVIFCVNREALVMQALKDFSSISEYVSILKSGYPKLFDINKPIQLVMLHSFNARKDLLKDFNANLIIVDECHLYHDGGMLNGLVKQFPNAKRLGVTGTPIDSQGYLLDGYDHYMQTVTMKDLIAQGTLSNPIYYASESNYNLDNVKLKGNDFDINDLEQYLLNVEDVNRIVNEWELKAKDKKTIIFTSSIKHANKLQQAYNQKGYNAYVLHSGVDDKERELLLKDFREGKRTIIINVAMLVEGFSDTEVECVVFACPTRVLRKFIQSAGRGFRRSKTKTKCIFLDCCGVFAIHGMPDDLRFYQKRKPKSNEQLFVECPECGNVQEIYKKECEVCGYDLRIIIEQCKGKSHKKKDIDRLVKVKSIQDDMYKALQELVKLRGYKQGYAYHLFRDLLSNATKQGTGSIFYNKIMRRIEKCKNGKTSAGKEYKLQWLKHQ